EGVVTVFTDINPNGNYTIFMPKDTTLAENQASAIDGKTQAIQSTLSRMRSEIDQLKKPKRMVCKVNSAISARTRYPQAQASIPNQEKRDGWQVTGGGCEQIDPNKNFALIKSSPAADGWSCITGDLPGTPQNVQVRAYVVYCKPDVAE